MIIRKEYLFSLIGLIWIFGTVNGQSISDYPSNPENKLNIKEGIFLTHDDFLHNRPLELSRIKTNLDTSSVDFYFELFKSKEIEYLKGDSIKQKEVKTIFGYFDGKGIYVNLIEIPSYRTWKYDYTSGYEFGRVNIFGELSVIYFAKQRGSYVSYGTPSNPQSFYIKEGKTYCLILDFLRGKAFEMNSKNMEYLLSEDMELQKEYKSSKEDEDIKPFIFIGKYNKRHPFQFK